MHQQLDLFNIVIVHLHFEKFSDDQRTISDRKNGVTLAHYVRISMMMFSVVLVLEAASRLKEYYSKEFYQ